MTHESALTVRPAVRAEIPLGADAIAVGEAPGKNEDIIGRPFIGMSGQLLRNLGAEVGLNLGYTNLFPWRPPENKLKAFCIRRAEAPAWLRDLPPLIPGYSPHPELAEPALDQLRQTLEQTKPKVVIALGNTACWALLQDTGIEKLAGTVHHCKLVPGLKVVPTYHPAAILRNWKLLPVLVMDLLKAKLESELKEIIYPTRWANIEPTIEDVAQYFALCSEYYEEAVAVDVETERKPGPHITMMGFARSPSSLLVIPFYEYGKEANSYWTKDEEFVVLKLIKHFLENSTVANVFHNCLYDLQWIYSYGINPQNAYHDTMLMSHALWPELPKSLRFLGRCWTRERAWKHIRKTAKRED